MMPASHHLHQALSGSLAGGADGPGFFLALADLKELALSRAALCLLRWSLGRSDWVQEAVSFGSCAVWVYCFWTGPRKRCMTPSVYFLNQLCNICLYYAVWHSVISSTIHKMGDLGWVNSSLNFGFKKNVQQVAKVWTLPVYCSRREVRVCSFCIPVWRISSWWSL